jgi:hypothetical protein
MYVLNAKACLLREDVPIPAALTGKLRAVAARRGVPCLPK